MRIDDLVRLETKPKRITNPFEYLEKLAFGKMVLNVGAAGGVRVYLPGNEHIWLHHRLEKVSESIIGIDIDQDGIDFARSHGVDILNANCETMSMDKKFDLIVLSDVIEHMNAPVDAVVNLMRHLAHGGVLCITTPNAISALATGKILTGGTPNVYWDHVACYSPEHIQAICDRYGYKLSEVRFFDHVDRRTFGNKVKSYLASSISMIYPRFATSFMAVIKNV
jgi:SAM-dependent methyltransferase